MWPFYSILARVQSDAAASAQSIQILGSKRTSGNDRSSGSGGEPEEQDSKEVYEELIVTALRYDWASSVREAERITFPELALYWRAQELKAVDRSYQMAELAFVQRATKATKGSGKNSRYVYTRPEQLFTDIREREKALLKGKPVQSQKFSRLRRMARRQKELLESRGELHEHKQS